VLIRNRDHLLIENVAVDPSRQHQGIGRALLAVAETHALSLATRILRLYTNTAMSENLELYPHLGHEQLAEVDARTTDPRTAGLPGHAAAMDQLSCS
jgi:GNAT superfamily N-acetyltransferase